MDKLFDADYSRTFLGALDRRSVTLQDLVTMDAAVKQAQTMNYVFGELNKAMFGENL